MQAIKVTMPDEDQAAEQLAALFVDFTKIT